MSPEGFNPNVGKILFEALKDGKQHLLQLKVLPMPAETFWYGIPHPHARRSAGIMDARPLPE
jgi:hypothetical protein